MRGNSCTLQFKKRYFMNVWEWDGDDSQNDLSYKYGRRGEKGSIAMLEK